MEFTFIILFIHALYDFIVWYGVYREQPGGLEWIYRTAKFLIDYPATIFFMFYFHMAPVDMYLTFGLKLTGFCDMVYIFIWWLITNRTYSESCKWFWWTFPAGWIKTIPLSWHYRRFIRGEIKFTTFKVQVAAGLLIYFLIKIIII